MRHAHNVFFQLNDGSPAACEKMVGECYQYLEGHDGMMSFSAGTRATECERDVNDLQFDVSLHVVFSDSQKHEAYQTAPRHVEFVSRNKAGWKSVRVFDSTLPPS